MEGVAPEIPDLTDDLTFEDRAPVFSGPYSSVFKGNYRGELVAIKMFQPVSNEQTMLRKLRREITVWAGLKHPNIVALYGYTKAGKDFGSLGSLISPWHANGDAAKFLNAHGSSLDLESRIRLWQETVAGVCYLHNHDPIIVHGDIKPNNILIGNDGTPKLCDFGLVCVFMEAGNTGFTTTSPHTGTERYLAPELLEQGAVPTTASDVYALGCVGLEFLFRLHPYAHHKFYRPGLIAIDISKGILPATRPEELTAEESELWSLLDHCWTRIPSNRQSATWIYSNIPGPDSLHDHTQHFYDQSVSCPMKCELCNCFCAVADHLHSLENDAVHLCGQTHVCHYECEQPGICVIETTPQSTESTFVGKCTTYQYTKYTQKARRLLCAVPIEPNQLAHDGPHSHSMDAAFHFCEERCGSCGYYCTLSLGHPQKEHETSHGSMSQTEWVVEGDEDAVLELEGRKYATGDSGTPMLCSMLCKSLGRHVHIDACWPDVEGNCLGSGIEHAESQHGRKQHDWITHRQFWARSGFRDPYTTTEQAEFDLCYYKCNGEEHDADANPGAVASYCTLPLFHSPADPNNPPALGHVSQDGHAYNCKNPATMQRSFHIFFALDRSSSMTSNDRRPLPNTPSTLKIAQRADNRFGAVLSSLYQFWTARDTAVRTGAGTGMRRDAYTIITFNSNTTVAISNDTTRNPDQLLNIMLSQANCSGRTNFTLALKIIQQQMESTWTAERYPVVIFLAGEDCPVADETVYNLCFAAVRLGKPLAFYAVFFNQDTYPHLGRMAEIARQVYEQAPSDPLVPLGSNPCTFTSALDTIQLATTLTSIANSIKNPRAALSRI